MDTGSKTSVIEGVEFGANKCLEGGPWRLQHFIQSTKLT